MKKTTTIKLNVNRILELKLLENGTYDVLLEVNEEEEKESELNDTKLVLGEDDLVIVEAESLSMDNEFMQYEPKNEKEEETKKIIIEAIQRGVRNFYKPRSGIAFTSYDSKKLMRLTGERFEMCKYSTFEILANDFMPERNSRLGSKFEYGAYLGILIKKLVEEGETINQAWEMVANNSEMLLGHIIKKNAIVNNKKPRVKDLYGTCDNERMCKILSWDKDIDGYWMTYGATRKGPRNKFRIAKFKSGRKHSNYVEGIAWIVFS